ncbi:MAG: mechanosensitive ion channel family protein [Gammaproteobacteria bacterium]|nr:mechanosensitive ion channel family protein [Gammaproteobacteria bacterium]
MKFFVFVLLLLHSVLSLALDPKLALRIGEAEAKLVKIEEGLQSPQTQLEAKQLRSFQEQGVFVKNTSSECIELSEKIIKKSAEDLELLGPVASPDDPEVTRKRKALNQNMLSHAQQLASCRLLLLRAHESIDITLNRQQQAIKSELLARTQNLFENFKNVILNPVQFLDANVEFIKKKGGLNNLLEYAFFLVPLLIVALILVLGTKKWLKARLNTLTARDQGGYLTLFQVSLLACTNRYLLPLTLSGFLSGYYIYLIWAESSWYFLGLLINGFFVYLLLNLVIRVMLNPCSPGKPVIQLSEAVSRLLGSRLRLLSKLLLAGFLVYAALEMHDFPPQITALLRNIYLFLLVINIIWAIWLLPFYAGFRNVLLLRSLIVSGLMLCLLADWLGYIQLSNFLFISIVGSILIWGITVFLIKIWTDFMDSLDEGRTDWQQGLRKRLGVQSGEFMPGSIWVRFTFSLFIWSVFAIAILKVWGLPDASLLSLKDTILAGFELGAVKIVPFKVIGSLLFFAFMLSIVGWIKRRMDQSWLNRSRMDRGSKEAMISLMGYLGVAIAFLIGLSIAGVELSSLALIAGALSVGIGFGLQNIVNNFISGVILLFERPIKTGDWIVVGGTEGYVKKISIRSTQIQTFDRADVMVPNSELISSQVTNWMFRDSIGRVILPIGVAYGSDPEQVKAILLDIAYQHPAVITQSPILSKPWVFFKKFGDSSLDFELRCFIKVVDERLRVIGDMNFALEKALKQANIVIPFPQRDLHLITNNDDKDVILPDSLNPTANK